MPITRLYEENLRRKNGGFLQRYEVYNVVFNETTISTVLTNQPERVDDWIRETKEIRNKEGKEILIVGLDCESRPSITKVQNHIATIQLCSGTRCLIFHICKSPYIPTSLKEFLLDSKNKFPGVGVSEYATKLEEDYHLKVGETIDLLVLAKDSFSKDKWDNFELSDLDGAGLRTLPGLYLGKKAEKMESVRMSKWDLDLTEQQVEYACLDAYFSFQIASNLYYRK